MAIWDSPRQLAAYQWFAVELANLRTAFQWASHCDDLDAAAAIATYAALLGYCTENFEPMTWAEELVERAAQPTIPGLRTCTQWPRCAGWSDGSKPESPTTRPVSWRSKQAAG